MTKGKIYLIPTNIGDGAVYDEMPLVNQSVIRELDYFIVENIRSARRFLSKAEIGKPIDTLEFVELNEHSRAEDIEPMLRPVLSGKSAGVLSEAGLPAPSRLPPRAVVFFSSVIYLSPLFSSLPTKIIISF